MVFNFGCKWCAYQGADEAQISADQPAFGNAMPERAKAKLRLRRRPAVVLDRHINFSFRAWRHQHSLHLRNRIISWHRLCHRTVEGDHSGAAINGQV